MSQLIESIWISNGRIVNLSYHQARYNKALRALFGVNPKVDFRTLISIDEITSEDCKCRLIYDANEISVEYISYERKEIKNVQIVYNDEVEYNFKYILRPELDDLFAKRNGCDEIIIIKNGFVTDAYYYNIIIQKDSKFYTPAKPLLHGVMRQYYLDIGRLQTVNITIEDLYNADNIFLINALNPIEKIIIEKIIA